MTAQPVIAYFWTAFGRSSLRFARLANEVPLERLATI